MGKRPTPKFSAAPLAALLATVLSRGRAAALGTVAALPDLPTIEPEKSTSCEVLVSADADALIRAAETAQPGTVFVHVGPAPPAPADIAAPHQLRLRWRPFAGDLLTLAAFTDIAVARLHENVDAPATYVTLWSTAKLPELSLGLHARTLPRAKHPPAPPPAAHTPVADPDTLGLARRLQVLEDRALAAGSGAPRGGYDLADAPGFEPPADRHPWPRAERHRDPAGFGLYDRRPDDIVLDEAAAGEAFLARHFLLGDTPDYSAAVAALNAIAPGLDTKSPPDVSIVIPVFGQLPYTLNALDSLLAHHSRYSAEILIIDDCSTDGLTSLHIPAVEAVICHRTEVNRGFVATCNEGAALARGRYVLLLNNDTRVAPGWLDRLIDSFVAFPRAGLVGSKMIFPDGRLQEAGNIIWRDGSVWNFGRGDDPNRPQYCHARPTDYVSGCSIALPTSLWRQLHGFDPAFAPAYAEDADLAQRVLQAGREVWFQPASRVVHYEGRTSGTKTDTGVKAHQVMNLRRLLLRWRRNFETHRFRGDAPYLERERAVRRRILVIDSVTPTPDQDAGSVQTALALRCCQAAGYKAVFVPEDNWLFVPGYTEKLQAAGVECAYAPFDTAFGPFIRRTGHLFDAVIVYRMQVLARCIDLLRMHAPKAPLIFHVADLHYLRTERQAALEANPAVALAAAAMKDIELDLVRRADCTVTHSTAEAAVLAHEAPGAPVVVWPLMMEVFGTSAPFADRRDVCFLGGYRHPPNEDAAVYFATAVLPLLREDIPDMRFVAAGANPSDRVQALAGAEVEVTGQVPDLAKLFDRCRVFVCPLRVGAGAKGKIASALAHGIPIVSTSVGVEGVGLIDGEHVLVADTPADMAASVLRLYRDPELWERLSQAGQSFIRYQASLEMGRRKLDQAIETAWRQKLGVPEIWRA